jgi:hypothetical protein
VGGLASYPYNWRGFVGLSVFYSSMLGTLPNVFSISPYGYEENYSVSKKVKES